MEGEEAVAAESGGAGGGDGESSSASDHDRKQRSVLGSAAAAEELPLALSRPIRNARLRSFLPSHYSIYGMPSRKAKAKAKAGKNRGGSMKERIAKILTPSSHRNNIDTSNLRRSTRKRRLSVSLYDSFSDGEDEILRHTYRAKSDEHVSSPTKKSSSAVPRREGLRPRTSQRVVRHDESSQEFEDGQDTSEDEDAAEDGEDEDGQETGEGEEEGEGDGEGEGDEDGEEDGEEEEEDEEIEEREGRRRYELRNRTEVQRFSPKRDDRQLRSRSPQKIFHSGTDVKHSREVRRSGSRPHKRHHRADDSDDSLLVDEMDQGPGVSWGRGARGPHPFLPATLDMHGSTNWGLGIAASGWGHQGDYWGFGLAGTGTQTAGASSKGGADIQPVQVDDTVNFDQVGGLSHYIDSLKEMVFFPLLYPKFFENYHITPPRGVLLCGPPGTGKTLVARALASAAGKAGQKVNFYMRKGADVLSKWVGEAERQLRMLFEEAQRCQPSIIFFDEIDGLAPVRSSKSEQIHNSIVSTLLALMDGLDSRGQVVVIGATNRIDAIDGALRRPGRFDREFIFPLPDSEARAEILDIHTRKWHRPPAEDLRKELSASCVGYCGADLKALCTEAAIRAFRERYPQVYRSDEQFVIDAESIKVQKSHFYEAMSAITPAAHRGAIVHSRPLPTMLAACLQGQLQTIISSISNIFPLINKVTISPDCDDDESPENLSRLFGLQNGVMFPLVYKPRYLLCGSDGSGLEHLGPALLHELERLPVHSLGLPSLLSDPSAKTPEEALVHIFGEARRNTPSILYLPQFHLWWDTAHDQLRTVLLMLLADLPPNLPVLFLGTSKNELDPEAISVFGRHIYEVQLPSPAERDQFFSQFIRSLLTTSSDKVTARPKKCAEVEDLPKAPKVEKGPSEAELRAQADAEEHVIRRLRMCLRDVCNRLLYEKRFSIFHFPVEAEEVPDYHTVVKNPMDVATLLQRVDNGHYMTRSSFMQDVELIPANAKLYHGEDYHTAARIVSKAYALRDAVQGMLSQMDPEMVAYCERIASQGGPMKLATAAADTQDIQGGPPKVEGGVTGQPASVTRSSARLRGVQPDLNVTEAPRKPSSSNEGIPPGDGATSSLVGDDVQMQECDNQSLMVEVVLPTPSPDPPELSNLDNSDEKSNHVAMEVAASPKPSTEEEDASESEDTSQDGISAEQLEHEISDLKVKLLLRTEDSTVSDLEMLYARICKMLQLHHQRGALSRNTILKSLQTFVEDDSNFQL